MISQLRTVSVRTRVFAVLAVLAGTLFVFPQIASAVVTENPRRDLPIALDGEVWAVEQVGDFVVVGGNFTQVQISRDGPIVDQAAIYAYHIDSGTFLDSFRPIIGRNNGNLPEIRSIVPTPDNTGLYIGGAFNSVDDRSDGNVRVRDRIALLELSTGRLDRLFSLSGVCLLYTSDAADE